MIYAKATAPALYPKTKPEDQPENELQGGNQNDSMSYVREGI